MDQLKAPDVKRRAVRVLVAGGNFYHPVATGPSVPADRIKVLRDAFNSAVKDPELLAKAEKARLETNWSTESKYKGWSKRKSISPSQY